MVSTELKRKLDKKILKALEKLNIKELFEYQEKAINSILNGSNTLIIAPTGMGKTEAAIIPAFQKILNDSTSGVKVLYITPLRALNRDLIKRLEFWGTELNLKVSLRHGDTPQSERSKQVKNPPDVLITTPETLQAILPGKRIKEILKTVKIVIIDEVHELIDSKRGVQLTVALERLVELAGDFQRVALSATVGNEELVAKFFFGNRQYKIIKGYREKEYQIEVVTPKYSNKRLNTEIDIDYEEVLDRIYFIIEESEKIKGNILVFCNTRTTAEVLGHRLGILMKEKEVGVHHSSLSKYVRIYTEEALKQGKIKTVVCTSSLELGIDIGTIEEVIQYKSPKQVVRLLQRVGRSGHRFDLTSKGKIVAEDFDDIVESSAIISLSKEGFLEEPEIHYGALDVLAHQIVGILMDFGKTNFQEIFRIVTRAYPYKDLTPEKLDKILSFLDKLRYLRYFRSDGNIKKTKFTWKYYYSNLSMIPEESKFEVIDKTTSTVVGYLDEKFVSEYGVPGQKFIHKGSIWEILEIYGEKIIVKPSKSIEGAIPSWIGEELPVPYEVARRYCAIISGNYPLKYVDKNSKEYFQKFMNEQAKFFKIEENKIVVEYCGNITIIHSFYGYKVNNTLSKLIASYITKFYGETVLYRFDPYRIVFYKKIDPLEVFVKFNKKSEIKYLLLSELERSTIFKWRFLQVAKRFGIIYSLREARRKVERLIEYLRDSPVYEEALNEILLEKFDIEKTCNIIKDIISGKIRIEYFESTSPSPLAQLGLKEYKIEVHKPRDVRKIIEKFLEYKIENTIIKVVCLDCNKQYLIKYKDLPDNFKCECSSENILIFLKEWEEKKQKDIKEKLMERVKNYKKYGKEYIKKELIKLIEKEE